jgi:ribosomal protein L7/L12
MIRIFKYSKPSKYKDFENYVFTSLSKDYFDIPNDKLTISGIDYRISTINNEVQCEECEECATCSFDVIMKSYTGGKIPVVKSVKAITGLGLKQAKQFVENLPQTLLSNVSYDDYESAKNVFVNYNSKACLDIIKLN